MCKQQKYYLLNRFNNLYTGKRMNKKKLEDDDV